MPVKARAGGQGRVRGGRVGAQQGTGGTPGTPTGDPSVGTAAGAATVTGVGTTGGSSSLVYSTNLLSLTSLPAEISLSRSTGGTRFNSSGVLVTEAADVARFDHDEATLAATGLLIEEARNNLCSNSQDFSASTWLTFGTGASKVGVAGSVSPDGTSNAYEVSLGTVGGAIGSASAVYTTTLSIVPSTPHTFSIWLRAKTGTTTARISLSTDGGSTNSDTGDLSLTTTWQRFPITSSGGSGGGNIAIRTNVAGNSANIYVYGAQLEPNSFATSYIPTTSSTAVRNADVLSSNSPLTGYLAAGPSVWEFQDEATGTIARSAYAIGAFDWPVNKWYRSMGVYAAGTDTSGHMTVGSSY